LQLLDISFLFDTQSIIAVASLGTGGARAVARVISCPERIVSPDASRKLFAFLLCKREKGAESLKLPSTIAHRFCISRVLRIKRCEFDHKVLPSFFIVSKNASLIIDREYSHLKVVPCIHNWREKEYLRIVSDTNSCY
jgi:hypothetical protein